jgi:hypothetical protein
MYAWGVEDEPEYIYVSKSSQPWLYSVADAMIYDSRVYDIVHATPVPYVLTSKGVRPMGSYEVTIEHPVSYYGSCMLPAGDFAIVANDTIYLYLSGTPKDIGAPISDYLDPETYDLNSAQLIYFDEKLFLLLPHLTDPDFNICLVYDIQIGFWSRWKPEYAPVLLAVSKDALTGEERLCYIDTQPALMQYEGGEKIMSARLTTKDDMVGVFLPKRVDEIAYVISAYDDVQFTATLKYDGGAVSAIPGVAVDKTFQGSVRPLTMVTQYPRAWSTQSVFPNLVYSLTLDIDPVPGESPTFAEVVAIAVRGVIVGKEIST